MTHSRRGFIVASLFLISLVCGCGRDGSGAKLVPVKGRVTFKNEGVTAASLYFLPDAAKGNRGTMASAILQEDGSFTLSTPPNRDGVAPGAYKVTFDLGRRPEPELAKFRTVERTPVEFDVPEEGLKDLQIELDKYKDKPKDKDAKDAK
jgi:hypothetical protein